MKTLVTTPNLQGEGGVSNYYAALRKYFPPSVEYFTVARRGGHEGLMASLDHLIRDSRMLRRRLRAHDYHVVHLNPSLGRNSILREGIFLNLAKRQGQKVVVFFRGWDRDFEESLRHWKLSLFKKVYFRADAMVVLGQEFEVKLRAWGYQGPIYLETTAVDDELFESFRCCDGVMTNNRINVLFMARVVRSKGIYEALEAYDQVRNAHGTLRFTVAGDGEDLDAVKRYIDSKSIEGVSFVGYVRGNEKVCVLQEHDIFLFPTYHGEGMPNSVLEAMAAGMPVVTRRVGGLKDFFEHGKMGFATEETSPGVFAEYLETLICNPELRRSMGQFNHAYARDRFAASSVAGRLESIYHTVAQSKGHT
jgi:glycosyltransferase involved in cell wall biosynthesis